MEKLTIFDKFKANYLFVLLGLFYLYEVFFNPKVGFGTDEIITYFTVLKGIGAVLVIIGVVMLETEFNRSSFIWISMVLIALLMVLVSAIVVV